MLCDECRACAKRTALTKQECPAIRIGNGKFVLHATFKCSKCDRRGLIRLAKLRFIRSALLTRRAGSG